MTIYYFCFSLLLPAAMNQDPQCVVFCGWLMSLSVMSSWLTHIVVNARMCYQMMVFDCMCAVHTCTYSPVDGPSVVFTPGCSEQ